MLCIAFTFTHWKASQTILLCPVRELLHVQSSFTWRRIPLNQIWHLIQTQFTELEKNLHHLVYSHTVDQTCQSHLTQENAPTSEDNTQKATFAFKYVIPIVVSLTPVLKRYLYLQSNTRKYSTISGYSLQTVLIVLWNRYKDWNEQLQYRS